MPQITWPAEITTISMAEYLALDALSSSACHTLLTRSPAHAYEKRFHPAVATSAMDLGTVVHRVLLERNENGISLVEADDWRTKVARQARDEAHEAGQIPLLAKAVDEVRAMVDVADTFIQTSELAGIFDRGKPEQTLLWCEGAVRCKARPDWLDNDLHTLVHFKTTQGSANPESFVSRMVDMGYDVAAAFYARGMQQVCGVLPSQLLTAFLVQETEPPYACALIGLAPSLMEIAVVKVEHALHVWETCLAEQRWPAYPVQICYAEARPWQITQMAEKALSWNDYDAYERITELAGGRSQ